MVKVKRNQIIIVVIILFAIGFISGGFDSQSTLRLTSLPSTDEGMSNRISFNYNEFDLSTQAFVQSGGTKPSGWECGFLSGQLNIFANTYEPDSVVSVGTQCSDNSQVTLYECSNDACSSITKEGDSFKIGGTRPRWTGFSSGVRYAYKCADCSTGGDCSISNPNACPQGGPFCLDNRFLCESGFFVDSDFFCDDLHIDCGANQCINDACGGDPPICSPGYEVCSDGIDFDTPDSTGDVYKCSLDGSDWDLEEQCSAGEECDERSSSNAICLSTDNFYCVTTNGISCFLWSGSGTPPNNCYDTRSECEDQFVYCYSSSSNACFTRLRECLQGETRYTSSSACSANINTCGNGICGINENPTTCPQDCDTTCSDFPGNYGPCDNSVTKSCAGSEEAILTNCADVNPDGLETTLCWRTSQSCSGGSTCQPSGLTVSCVSGGGGCTEDWSCNEWSNSTGACGTRTCTDANSCGTSSSKPSTTKTCGGGTPGVQKCIPLFTEEDANGDCIPQWIYIGIAIGLIALIVLSKKK